MWDYRTGVRAAVDWLFIRVQNSRRSLTFQYNHCSRTDAITLGTHKKTEIIHEDTDDRVIIQQYLNYSI